MGSCEKIVYPGKELLKGPVQSLNVNTEEVQAGAVYIISFLYILPLYIYLYTQFQKKTRPGKMLNFTKIHRQNYKKLSPLVEILIPSMFCKIRNLDFNSVDQDDSRKQLFFLSRYTFQ